VFEHYLNVFIESARAASAVPFGTEVTLAAMHAFGGFSMPLAFSLALLGIAVGSSFNYLLGMLLWREFPSEKAHPREYFRGYGGFLLLVSCLPLLNLAVVVAGYYRYPIKRGLPLIFVGHIAYMVWEFGLL
jgi:membrane protein YqaA with SNARE-associated domain